MSRRLSASANRGDWQERVGTSWLFAAGPHAPTTSHKEPWRRSVGGSNLTGEPGNEPAVAVEFDTEAAQTYAASE